MIDKSRRRQGSFLKQARDYALTRNYVMFESFVRRAVAVRPLSDHQWFRLQVLVGSSRVDSLREVLDTAESLL